MASKVSVIIPCYNQGEYLEETLRSVREQTYPDWECLMIDDGSSDRTAEICQKWQSVDKRFLFIQKNNEGVTKTRNLGLELAKGDWIQFLDADDLLKAEKLKKSMQFEDAAELIITDFEMIANDGILPPFCDLSKYEFTFENLIKGWDVDFNLPIHCALINKNFLGNARWPVDFKAKEDWLFWLEVFNKPGITVKFIPEKLAVYRMNPEGASKNFQSVYAYQLKANKHVYDIYDIETKEILFNKVNEMNFRLNKTNFEQKKYIRQLQNTKVLKWYFLVKNMVFWK